METKTILQQAYEQGGHEEIEKRIQGFLEKMDDKNIQILTNFYITGRPFPNDTQPLNFAVLCMQLSSEGFHFKTNETIRKRMKKLVDCGLVVKWSRTNPAIYNPIRDEFIVRIVKEKLAVELKKRPIFSLMNRVKSSAD